MRSKLTECALPDYIYWKIPTHKRGGGIAAVAWGKNDKGNEKKEKCERKRKKKEKKIEVKRVN
jgi:hypothetical protein